MKRIVLFILAILLIMQAFPVKRNNSNDKEHTVLIPTKVSDTVISILAKACLDCHSNNTNYPWYYFIEPVGWWMADHINDGKKELNFDTFKSYSLRRQYHKMEKIIKEVEEKEMPLESYTWIHDSAKLNSNERQVIIGWAKSYMDQMKKDYPLDSLIKKK